MLPAYQSVADALVKKMTDVHGSLLDDVDWDIQPTICIQAMHNEDNQTLTVFGTIVLGKEHWSETQVWNRTGDRIK
jgi:hypothetical protein